MDQDHTLPDLFQPDTGIPLIERENISAQRRALQARAYSDVGKSEGFISRIPAHVRPTTIARLQLFARDPDYGFPSLDQAVDEAIHTYLVMMGY